MSLTSALLICACLCVALFGLYFLRRAWLAFQERVRITSACGYLGPPTTAKQLAWIRLIAKIFLFWQVGKIKIRGIENLQTPGPRVVAPNHGHFADPLVWPIILTEPARYLVAQDVFTSFGGLPSPIVSASGGIPVDLTHGKGTAARLSAVRALSAGDTLVMFPEGLAYMDGGVRAFKKGLVRISRETSQTTEAETYIVPAYMKYGKYPGTWINRFSHPVQFFLIFILAPFYRSGLEVVIGKADRRFIVAHR